MTGTIKSLGGATESGFITTENGLNVGFCPTSVLAYDAASLAVGQLVSFDLESGRYLKALNVSVQRARDASNMEQKRLEVTRLRYMGFEQHGSVRAYRFERLTPGSDKRTFTVEADMALFARHHVGIQEGPALCLHLLVADLEAAGEPALFQRSLSDREMLAHLASLPVRKARHGIKRTPPASGASGRAWAVSAH
jgi:cold shock CspA family protein